MDETSWYYLTDAHHLVPPDMYRSPSMELGSKYIIQSKPIKPRRLDTRSFTAVALEEMDVSDRVIDRGRDSGRCAGGKGYPICVLRGSGQ